jgi:hypothetical protein
MLITIKPKRQIEIDSDLIELKTLTRKYSKMKQFQLTCETLYPIYLLLLVSHTVLNIRI